MQKFCFILGLFLFSGIADVRAAVQDWPCDEIVLQKAGVNEDGKGFFRGV